MMILKVVKRIFIVLFCLIFVLVLGYSVTLLFENIQAHQKIANIEKSIQPIDALKISPKAQLVSIGEAAHGSSDFQELKLDVLKKLVQEDGFTAFALEADYGECATINRYIQGKEGSIDKMLQNFSFPIYHTEQMKNLIQWMHDYNQSAPKDKKLRFYGFDMQNPETSYDFLKHYCLSHGYATEEEFDSVLGNESITLDAQNAQKVVDFLRGVRDKMGNYNPSIDDDRDAALEINSVTQAANTWLSTPSQNSNTTDGSNSRDADMAKNVETLLKIEEKIGSGKMLIAAHNGHIGKSIYSKIMGDTMGVILSRDLGEKYYAIGTDFWEVTDNIKTFKARERSIQKFISADPLAAQARFAKEGKYFLDFSATTDQNSKIYQLIHSPMRMGDVGEGYMWLMRLFPNQSSRIKVKPSQMFDSMIFVYKAKPIEIF